MKLSNNTLKDLAQKGSMRDFTGYVEMQLIDILDQSREEYARDNNTEHDSETCEPITKYVITFNSYDIDAGASKEGDKVIPVEVGILYVDNNDVFLEYEGRLTALMSSGLLD